MTAPVGGTVPALKKRGKLDVTVIIPTFNGEKYIGDILQALAEQSYQGSHEVLVIDSGSTDRTLDIVREFDSVRVHEIPQAEFGHGKTRNLGAQLAQGTFVVFLTHDAIPSHPEWLTEITAPLDPKGLGAVAVMGKQIPRPGCFPLLKYEIQGVFAGFGPDFGTTIFYKGSFVDSQSTLDALSFYSDVNSATRRDILTGPIPLQDVPYSEDMAFGLDVIEAGYRKAYAPRGSVIHSNDLTLSEYRHRIFDEVVGMRRIGHDIPVLSRFRQLGYTGVGALRDGVRIMRDRDFSFGRKLYWLVVNPWFHVAKWRSYYRATRVDLNDDESVAAGSLEARRKKA